MRHRDGDCVPGPRLRTNRAVRFSRRTPGPGTVIDLAAVRAEHEVSRTVTRETLRTLTAKGLVTALPNLGTRVTAPDRWHLLDPDVVGWTPQPSPDLDRFVDAVRVIGELLPGNRFYDHLMRTLARA